MDLDQFIDERARDLHIVQDSGETEESWVSRVIYSVIGVMSSSCLWNNDDLEIDEIYHESTRKNVIRSKTRRLNEENMIITQGVSDVYWKRFVKQLWYAYYSKYSAYIKNFYPYWFDKLIKQEYADIPNPIEEQKDTYDVFQAPRGGNWEDLISEILDIYIQTGSFYKRNYYLAPAKRRSITMSENISLERGVFPGEFLERLLSVSGLGYWQSGTFSANPDNNFETLFDLQNVSYELYYQHLESRFEQEAKICKELYDDSKYLRTEPDSQIWGTYWMPSFRPREDGLLLGRYGYAGKERYYLFRREGKSYAVLDLSEFETNPIFRRPRNGSREYIRIACAILAHRGVLPNVHAKIGTGTVEIKFGYLLPPSELSFLKLYSWPSKGFKTVGQNYNRRIAKELYPPFRDYLKKLGYKVIETIR